MFLQMETIRSRDRLATLSISVVVRLTIIANVVSFVSIILSSFPIHSRLSLKKEWEGKLRNVTEP
jgi:hypothetical protein